MSMRLSLFGVLVVVATATAVGYSVTAADPKAADAPKAPEFPADAVWLQGGPLKPADLRGRVVVVTFWTNGCINCIHNYPLYREWAERYADKKFTLVGVHTPEFDSEAPAAVVRAKAKENKLEFPIVLDTDKAIWKAWENKYWPAIYVLDKEGRVRGKWDGELHLKTDAERRFAARIEALLKE